MNVRVLPIALVIAILAVALSAPAQPPNIVFILADDLGYGDLACYGREDIETPRIDSIGAAGARFTDFYANGPECTPTRAAFMTGRYQNWIGGLECAIGTGNVGRYDDANRLANARDLGLPVAENSIARILKEAGYATALTGKWHLGYEAKFAPSLHGFDYTFYCIGGGMDYFHYLDTEAGYNLFQDGDPIRREGYFTELMTDEALGFIEANQERPFFLYLPYTAPHSPFQGPEDLQQNPLPLDSPLWRQGNAPPDTYIGMIESMDEQIGRVLDQLDVLGLAENTVVVFTSDNGGTGSARNAPLRGNKGATLEGGIRVPLLVRWPGKIAPGTVSNQVGITFDLTKSFAQIGGGETPDERPFEGMDIIGHVGSGAPTVARTLYWRKQRGTTVWRGVREGALKYVLRDNNGAREGQLYDLAEDIGEKNDLRVSRPEAFTRLETMHEAWEREVRHDRRGQGVADSVE